MESAEIEQLALEYPSAWRCWENTCGTKMLIGASSKYLVEMDCVDVVEVILNPELDRSDALWSNRFPTHTQNFGHSSFLEGKGDGKK